MLAQLARRKLDTLSTEVYEAQFKLKAPPSSRTLELGNYLSSLDDIKVMVKLVCFFPFLTPLSFLGSWGGCWNLFQLHMGEGRIYPLMSHQIPAGDYMGIGGSVPCSRVPLQFIEDVLVPPPATRRTPCFCLHRGLRTFLFSAQTPVD